jgi:CheY-like chemotaxis protein
LLSNPMLAWSRRHPARERHYKMSVVLIVEDEEIIRMAAVQMIEDAGYAAVDTSSADHAVTILEGRNDIRAVFTNIRMPGSTDGMELARTIQNRWPLISVIVTSSPEEDACFPFDWRYIRKPYASAQVTAALRDLAA